MKNNTHIARKRLSAFFAGLLSLCAAVSVISASAQSSLSSTATTTSPAIAKDTTVHTNLHIEDRLQIADLMNGWMHRDISEWEALRGLFHSDGTIEISWFEGPAIAFVEGSKRMSKSDIKTKHLIGAPVVTFNNTTTPTKAIVETNAMVVGENPKLELGCTIHNRFYDMVEKRNGTWKIVRRQTIYDMGSFTFPQGLVEIDKSIAAKYPREYAALGYLCEKSGFPVQRVFATKDSELERTMKAEGQLWLKK